MLGPYPRFELGECIPVRQVCAYKLDVHSRIEPQPLGQFFEPVVPARHQNKVVARTGKLFREYHALK